MIYKLKMKSTYRIRSNQFPSSATFQQSYCSPHIEVELCCQSVELWIDKCWPSRDPMSCTDFGLVDCSCTKWVELVDYRHRIGRQVQLLDPFAVVRLCCSLRCMAHLVAWALTPVSSVSLAAPTRVLDALRDMCSQRDRLMKLLWWSNYSALWIAYYPAVWQHHDDSQLFWFLHFHDTTEFRRLACCSRLRMWVSSLGFP